MAQLDLQLRAVVTRALSGRVLERDLAFPQAADGFSSVGQRGQRRKPAAETSIRLRRVARGKSAYPAQHSKRVRRQPHS